MFIHYLHSPLDSSLIRATIGKMCKSWNITYSCTHTRMIRLSKCRGTVYTKAKPTSEPRAACCSTPILTFKAAGACGGCKRAPQEKALEKTLLECQTQFSWGDPRREAAESEYQHQLHLLHKTVPDSKRYKGYRGPDAQTVSSELPSSSLRTEIFPEDVESINDEWAEWASEWESGWTSPPNDTIDDGVEDSECFAYDLEADHNPYEVLIDKHNPYEELVGVGQSEESLTDGLLQRDDMATTELTRTEDNEPERSTRTAEVSIPFKALPPHARRRSSAAKQNSRSDDTSMELDLLERLKCFRYQRVIAVSSWTRCETLLVNGYDPRGTITKTL